MINGSDPNFEISNYWITRYDNEQILNVNEHGTRPLNQIPRMMAYG